MTRSTGSIICVGVLSALLLTSCATTKLTSVWKDPSFQKPPHKIMVIGIAKKPVNKRLLEDEFVKQIKARGTDAVASYTVMSDAKQENHAVIAAKMKELDADAVVISRLASKKSVNTYVPGSFCFLPYKYGNWRDYYGYGSHSVHTPDYNEDEYALMETTLYDALTDNLIWSATSETEIRGSDQNDIKSYVHIMVDAMASNKLLK